MRSALAHLRRHVIAYVALFFALGGTSYAASVMWTGANITDGSLTGADVQDGSLQASDLEPSAGGAGAEILKAQVEVPSEFSDTGPGEPDDEYPVLDVAGLGLLYVAGCADGPPEGSADQMWLRFRNTSDSEVVVATSGHTQSAAPGATVGVGNPGSQDTPAGYWEIRNPGGDHAHGVVRLVLSRDNATLSPTAWLDISNSYEQPGLPNCVVNVAGQLAE